MELAVWLAAFIVLLFSFYWYMTIHHNYWKRIGIPYIPASIFIGSQKDLIFKATQDIEIERYVKYGRLYGYYEGRKPALSIADPDTLRNIYSKDFSYFTTRRNLSIGDTMVENMVSVVVGEQWKRIRALITPAFTTGKIKKMVSIFIDSAKTLEQNFEKAVSSKKPLDAKRYFGAFTMDVIASSAFATKIDSHNDPDNEFAASAREIFGGSFPWRALLLFVLPFVMKPLRIPIFPPKATDFFKDCTLEIIKERRRTGQTRNDFLQLLMEAADEVKSDAAIDQAEAEEEGERAPRARFSENQKVLTQDELVSQCVIFFLAAYDTTASTLSFLCYEMALNPEIQELLIDDIDTNLAKNKNRLSYEAIQEMKYMDNVISETLRMYPPVLRLDRTADKDYRLGDLVIPKGMVVGAPAYAMHHDPEYYPDPEKFDPDRFTSEAKAERHPYVYMPFGLGPRNCIGMRFAMIEIKICLAHIFSHFRVKRCPETKAPLEYLVGQNLLQPKEIMLGIERRSDKQIK